MREGLAYCFLPLPVKTGFPCHVNGYFELSRCALGPYSDDLFPQTGAREVLTDATCCSNRRDVWTGGDLRGVGKLRAEWNIQLLQVS